MNIQELQSRTAKVNPERRTESIAGCITTAWEKSRAKDGKAFSDTD
jgi:hypothetical protein